MATQLVSIVFTDLVKSTAVKSLLPGTDIESRNQSYIATIEEPHRQRIVAGLEDAGGRIVKNTGDGFLLIFTDPCQAARWSLTLQRAHEEQPIATPWARSRSRSVCTSERRCPTPMIPTT